VVEAAVAVAVVTRLEKIRAMYQNNPLQQ